MIDIRDRRAIASSARSDTLVLQHWVPSHTNPRTGWIRTLFSINCPHPSTHPTKRPNKDYSFAKLNKKVDVPFYSDEDYEKYIKDDGRWNKEKTDHLFLLCKEFDLRFIVIADRFRAKYPNFSIEDLQERYHSVSKKLLISENENSLAPLPQLSENPLFKFPFDAGLYSLLLLPAPPF